MEFPDLGENCSSLNCNKLDFLPVKCDACSKIFCNDHYPYTSHNCQSSQAKNNQVPVCPLCNRPISILKHQNVDEVVGRHIDNDCNSELAQNKRKIYNMRCSMKNCKQKEMVQLDCPKCRLNFCLRHRHELDHDCGGFVDSRRSISMARKSTDNSPRITALKIHSIQQPTLSEEEALQKALQLSLQNLNTGISFGCSLSGEEKQQQEEEDAYLARVLQESENAQQDTRIVANDGRSNCSVS